MAKIKKPKSSAKKISNRNTPTGYFALPSRPTADTNQTTTSIPLINQSDKKFLINIAENRLDVYTSPHLLNLSVARQIEKSQPQPESAGYTDWPAGKLLEKIKIISLLDFKTSEILIGCKTVIRWLTGLGSSPSGNYQLLADKKTGQIKLSRQTALALSEISFINFSLFLYHIFATLVALPIRAVKAIRQLFRLAGDEVISLEKKPLIKKLFKPKISPTAKILQESDEPVDIFDGLDGVKNEKISPAAKPLIKPLIPAPLINSAPSAKRKKVPGAGWLITWSPKFSIKPILFLAVLILAMALPFKAIDYWQAITAVKGKILGETTSALNDFNSAKIDVKNFNLTGAESYLSQANNKFVSAQNQLAEIRSFLTWLAEAVPAQNTFKSGKNILELGEHLSSAGEMILNGLNEFSSSSGFSLASKLKNFKLETQTALAELESAQKNLADININHLPAGNRQQFMDLKNNLPVFISSLKQLTLTMDFAVNFLGDSGLKRYLLVFQNDNEIRATGGFMGSFALVDLRDGQIDKISLPSGGTYDLRYNFSYVLKPPTPLSLVNSRFELQDANWWPDFPTSAKAIEWFYNKSGGPTIDGVIAINSDWLSELLKVTGPIDLPQYGKTISAENFEIELQKSIELEATQKNQSKKILADLAPKLLAKILTLPAEQFLPLATALNQGLNDKNILVYLNQAENQNFIAQNNWDGRLKAIAGDTDYLQVVVANIGGGKTDAVIKQQISHRVEILADGRVIDQVLISRYHFGPTDQYFTNRDNDSYLRIYTPAGSKLIKAIGFNPPLPSQYLKLSEKYSADEFLLAENLAQVDSASQTLTYQEQGKTVFANWLQVAPGEEKTALLVYELPYNLSPKSSTSIISKITAAFAGQQTAYSLLIQKQPGLSEGEIISEVIYPSTWQRQTVYPSGQAVSGANNNLVFSGNSKSDDFYFVNFKN